MTSIGGRPILRGCTGFLKSATQPQKIAWHPTGSAQRRAFAEMQGNKMQPAASEPVELPASAIASSIARSIRQFQNKQAALAAPRRSAGSETSKSARNHEAVGQVVRRVS